MATTETSSIWLSSYPIILTFLPVLRLKTALAVYRPTWLRYVKHTYHNLHVEVRAMNTSVQGPGGLHLQVLPVQ